MNATAEAVATQATQAMEATEASAKPDTAPVTLGHLGCTVSRDVLFGALSQVLGSVPKRATMEVLSHVLLRLDGTALTLTGSDLETEMVTRCTVTDTHLEGAITLPAHKLAQALKACPAGAAVKIRTTDGKARIQVNRSRFTMATLPPGDFPLADTERFTATVTLPGKSLEALLHRTAAAMAVGDVRFYLNGLFLDASDGKMLRAVATDGHRLHLASREAQIAGKPGPCIVPSGAVHAMDRLVRGFEDDVVLRLAENSIRLECGNVVLSSKLIDGKYPDYKRVLRKPGDAPVRIDREELLQSVGRVSVLTNEKYQGITLVAESAALTLQANNQASEEATETLPAGYEGAKTIASFGVGYLRDALQALGSDQVELHLPEERNASAMLILDPEESGTGIILMSMRL